MTTTSNHLFKINVSFLYWFDHRFRVEANGEVGLANKMESVGIPAGAEHLMRTKLETPMVKKYRTEIKQVLDNLCVPANSDMTQIFSMLVLFIGGEVPHVLIVHDGVIEPLSLTAFGAVNISERRDYEYVFTDQQRFFRLKPDPYLA